MPTHSDYVLAIAVRRGTRMTQALLGPEDQASIDFAAGEVMRGTLGAPFPYFCGEPDGFFCYFSRDMSGSIEHGGSVCTLAEAKERNLVEPCGSGYWRLAIQPQMLVKLDFADDARILFKLKPRPGDMVRASPREPPVLADKN